MTDTIAIALREHAKTLDPEGDPAQTMRAAADAIERQIAELEGYKSAIAVNQLMQERPRPTALDLVCDAIAEMAFESDVEAEQLCERMVLYRKQYPTTYRDLMKRRAFAKLWNAVFDAAAQTCYFVDEGENEARQ